MLQSPEFADMLRMLQSPGPVNMGVARKTAQESASHDTETEAAKPDLPVSPEAASAYDDVVRAVQLSVAEATSMSAALAVPARTVDRAQWADATLTGLEPVLAALASGLSRGHASPAGDEPRTVTPDAFLGMLMPNLAPMILGWWSGAMIGALSHHALGQYDLPLPLAGKPTMLFVAHNVEDFAREWSLPIDELRYALVLREVVHGAQRAEPWIRDRLVRLAETYVEAYEVRPEAIEDFFADLDFGNPAAFEGLEQFSDPQLLLGAMQSDRQRPLLEEIQRFVAVLEGYTDVVVSTLGARMVASHAQIDEALRRHRLERGSAATSVDRLLGLELDRGHYDSGLAFCRGVVERSDGSLEALNRLWTREEMLPTPSELDAPGLWLARIELPEP
jgi:putative hydrolase